MREEEISEKDFDAAVKRLTGNLIEIHDILKIDPQGFVNKYALDNNDPFVMAKNENLFWGILIERKNVENARGMLGKHNEALAAWMLESTREDYEALVKPVIEKVRSNYPALIIFAPYYDKGDGIEDSPIMLVEFSYFTNTQVPDEHMATQLIRGMMMLEEGILDAMEEA